MACLQCWPMSLPGYREESERTASLLLQSENVRSKQPLYVCSVFLWVVCTVFCGHVTVCLCWCLDALVLTRGAEPCRGTERGAGGGVSWQVWLWLGIGVQSAPGGPWNWNLIQGSSLAPPVVPADLCGPRAYCPTWRDNNSWFTLEANRKQIIFPHDYFL